MFFNTRTHTNIIYLGLKSNTGSHPWFCCSSNPGWCFQTLKNIAAWCLWWGYGMRPWLSPDVFIYKIKLWSIHICCDLWVRASPPTLSTWPCSGNLGWGSSVDPSESTGRLLGPWRNAQTFRPRDDPRTSVINAVKSYLLSVPCY
jgi:hypothetical protein